MNPSRWIAGFFGTVLIIGLLGSAGCRPSVYVRGYAFYPQPAAVEVLSRGGEQPSPLTVLISVLGVHKQDVRKNIPYSVVLRLRFENTGSIPVVFDPRTLDLVTGTLQPFEPALPQPDLPVTIPPGRRITVSAKFPFPSGRTPSDMDLSHLRLRWEVTIDKYPVVQTAAFDRIEGGRVVQETDEP